MERRVFLTGLLGVAGAAAFASVAAATPLARPLELLDDKFELDAAPAKGLQAKGLRTPDGTPVEQAQTVVVRTGPRRRYWHRHYRRAHRRCRTYWSRGRRITRCW